MPPSTAGRSQSAEACSQPFSQVSLPDESYHLPRDPSALCTAPPYVCPGAKLSQNSGFQRFRIVLLALSWPCELSTKGGKGGIEVPFQELTEREG